MISFIGSHLPLPADAIQTAAKQLSCEPEALLAVMRVEAGWRKPGDGFIQTGAPKMLFEPHVFGARTQHRFEGREGTEDLTSRRWDRTKYGAAGKRQYDKIARAMALSETAALESASWGFGQTMGFNNGLCGHASVVSLVEANVASETGQLAAFTAFLVSTGCATWLRTRDFIAFARRYNGAGYAANAYDVKLAAEYALMVAAHREPPLPTDAPARIQAKAAQAERQLIRQIQIGLNLWQGLDLVADGIPGPKTQAALDAFRAQYGMTPEDSLQAVATAMGL
jgi:hypothetical protein